MMCGKGDAADYRQMGGKCLSRPWRVEVSAVAFSSLWQTVATPFCRGDSVATVCHRRCSETFKVFATLRLSEGGGLQGPPSWLLDLCVRDRPVPDIAQLFGMRLACSPANAGSQRTCLSFLADLSASALELLGDLRRATEVGKKVENIDTQTVPRAEFMALVALAENVKIAGLYHCRVDPQVPSHHHCRTSKSDARNRWELVDTRNSRSSLAVWTCSQDAPVRSRWHWQAWRCGSAHSTAEARVPPATCQSPQGNTTTRMERVS